MRPILVSCVFVALLALAVPASALCLPTCDVVTVGAPLPGRNPAFVPPLTVIESGSSVSWSSVDGRPHTATDDTDAFCFWSDFDSVTPGVVTFFIANAQLWAESDLGFAVCDLATALPDGSFTNAYYCAYHPDMIGQLVIR